MTAIDGLCDTVVCDMTRRGAVILRCMIIAPRFSRVMGGLVNASVEFSMLIFDHGIVLPRIDPKIDGWWMGWSLVLYKRGCGKF